MTKKSIEFIDENSENTSIVIKHEVTEKTFRYPELFKRMIIAKLNKEKHLRKGIRTLNQFILDCLVEKLDPDIKFLKVNDRVEVWYDGYCCEQYKFSTPQQCQDIMSQLTKIYRRAKNP